MNKAIAIIATAGAFFTLGHTIAPNAPAAPMAALVGHGCEGATGPIYAESEDFFPPCASIERASDQGMFDLIGETDGEGYRLDYGISGDDCAQLAEFLNAHRGQPEWPAYDALYCEAEG